MKIGVAKEIKPDEYRVALTPAGARELVLRGHEVLIETGAGAGSAFHDGAYEAVGAGIGSVDEVWNDAELLLKVKEPVPAEFGRLRESLVLFTYLHLAADEPLTRALDTFMNSGGARVTIGRELGEGAMEACSLIGTGIASTRFRGSLGVLGPVRMPYPRLLSLVSYIGERLAELP